MTTNVTEAGAAAKPPSILALAAVTGLAPLGLNIIVPSVPGLAVSFNVDYATAQLVVTAFIAAMALGQLAIGTLSDAYGRRSVLMIGIAIFIVGSLICALAPTIEILIAGRFIEAAGGVAGVVLGRAIIRDAYGRDKSASALGYVTMVMVVAPMLAPAAGGFIDDQVGWRATFWLLAGIGVALIFLIRARLAETNVGARRPARLSTLVGSFVTLLSIRAFIGFTLAMSFASSMFFTFLGAAPYVSIELLGNTPTEYGLAFLSISISFMAGNFAAARLAQRVGTMPLILVGCVVGIFGAGVMAAFVYFGDLTTFTLFGPMMIITFSNGLSMPNAVASAVSVRPDLAGASSGLSGSVQFGIAGIATYVVALSADGTAGPMAVQLGVLAVLTVAAVLFAWRASSPRE